MTLRQQLTGFLLALVQIAPAAAFAQAQSSGVPQAPQKITLPPAPQGPKSPVDQFRQLLAMTPAERKDFLTNRPPESRTLMLAKVHEYEAFPPDERELRLKETELQWYLLPLLKLPAAGRGPRLATIPQADLKLVEVRLARWDQVPADLQKELLDNLSVVRFVLATNRSRASSTNISSANAQMLQRVQDWEGFPREKRARILHQFDDYFTLNPDEKDKTLQTLSEPERRQLETTLNNFAGLDRDQRRECIRSFEKFASLGPEERRKFLKNAEQWKAMTPAQRQAWRDVVQRISLEPPQPFPPPTLPPIPKSVAREPRPPMLTITN
jgi:hypothetical protein